MGQMNLYARQFVLTPDALTMDDQSLASDAVSATINATGYNQLTLEVAYTYAAGTTAVTITVEVSNDASAWHNLQEVSWASGTGTLTDATWSKAVSAADVDFAVNIPCNYKYMRFTVGVSGTPTASDTVKITGRLGVV